jgi:hypothetical protein
LNEDEVREVEEDRYERDEEPWIWIDRVGSRESEGREARDG